MRSRDEFKNLIMDKEKNIRKNQKKMRTRFAAVAVPLVICAAVITAWLNRPEPQYAADSVSPEQSNSAQVVSPFVPMTVVVTKGGTNDTSVYTKDEILYAVEGCFADAAKTEAEHGSDKPDMTVVITYENGTTAVYNCFGKDFFNKNEDGWYTMGDASFSRLAEIISAE